MQILSFPKESNDGDERAFLKELELLHINCLNLYKVLSFIKGGSHIDIHNHELKC